MEKTINIELTASSNSRYDSIFSVLAQNNISELKKYINRNKKTSALLKSRLNSFYTGSNQIKGVTPLIFAIKMDFIEAVSVLLANGADIEKQSTEGEYQGMSPLYIAVINNQAEIAEVLLKNQANSNAIVQSGADVYRTPLIASIVDNVDPTIIEILVAYGAKNDVIKEGDFKGLDPVTAATNLYVHGKLAYKKLEILLKSLKLNLDSELSKDFLPKEKILQEKFNSRTGATYMNLIIGALKEPGRIIALLESLAVDFANNPTPLYWAADNGNLELLEKLFQRGAKVNAVIPEGLFCAGDTALIAACNDNNLATVKFLVEKYHADIHQVCPFGDNMGFNPLSIAASENLEIVEYLLSIGADADFYIAYNTNALEGPLTLAAKRNNVNIVNILLTYSKYKQQIPFDKNINALRSLALVCAIQNNNKEIFELIIKAGVDANEGCFTKGILAGVDTDLNLSTIELAEKYYNTSKMWLSYINPLLAAINYRRFNLIENLLNSHLINPNLTFTEGAVRGLTPLACALIHQDPLSASILLKYGAEVDINITEGLYKNSTILAMGFGANNIELVKLLSSYIEDVNKPLQMDNDSYLTPLHIAILNQNITVIEYLVHHCNASITTSINFGVFTGLTPLNAAILTSLDRQNYEILFVLFKDKLTQEIKDEIKEGNSFLYALAKAKKYDLIELLLDHGYEVNSVNTKGINKGETTLYFGVKEHDLELIKLLLNYQDVEPEKILNIKNKPKSAVALAELNQNDAVLELFNTYIKQKGVNDQDDETNKNLSNKKSYSSFFQTNGQAHLTLKADNYTNQDLSQNIILQQDIHPLLHHIYSANEQIKINLEKLAKETNNKKILFSALALSMLRKHEAMLKYALLFSNSYFVEIEKYHQVRNVIMHLFWLIRNNPENLVNVAKASITSQEMQFISQLIAKEKTVETNSANFKSMAFPASYTKQLANADNALTIGQLQQELLKEIKLCDDFAKPIKARYQLIFYPLNCQALKMSFTAIGQYVRLLERKNFNIQAWLYSQFFETKKNHINNASQFLNLCKDVRKIIGHDFSNERLDDKSYGFADEKIGQADIYGLILAVKRLVKNIDFAKVYQVEVSQQSLKIV